MRARWNETSERILSFVAKKNGVKVEDIAQHLGANPSNISTILLRMFRQGCVLRDRVQDGTIMIDRDEGVTHPRYVYVYSVTDRGMERLKYISVGMEKRRIPLRKAANPRKRHGV